MLPVQPLANQRLLPNLKVTGTGNSLTVTYQIINFPFNKILKAGKKRTF
jgi:hypothetical protein